MVLTGNCGECCAASIGAASRHRLAKEVSTSKGSTGAPHAGGAEAALAGIAVALVLIGLLIQTRATIDLLSRPDRSTMPLDAFLVGLVPSAIGAGMMIGLIVDYLLR